MNRQLLFLSIGLLSTTIALTSCVCAEVLQSTTGSPVISNAEFRGQGSCQSCQGEVQTSNLQCNSSVPLTAAGPSAGTYTYNNSTSVSSCSPMELWEKIISVLTRYFPIYIENACRQIGDHVTPGNLVTGRTIGATIFEPWRKDSVGFRERWESTIHSISRYAVVRVWPTGINTYTIEVIVYKDIENTSAPDNPSTGQSNYFLSDSRSTFRDNIMTDSNNNQWINRGRDPLLEQRILAEIMAKVN